MRTWVNLSCWMMISTVALLGTAYADLSFSSFQHSYTVNANPHYVLYWNLTNTEIVFGLDVASNRKWVGLGIAEPTTGSMPGADMAILQVQSGVVSLQDYYATAKSTPVLDSCQSLALVSSAVTAGGNVQAIFKRRLNTSDPQDRVINSQVGYSTKMVWAIGSGDTFSYHGTTKRGPFGVYLNGGEPGPVNSSWSSWTIAMSSYTVPAQETTYTCLSAPMPQDKAYYIKRFEFVNSNTLTSSKVHHILMYSCTNTANGEYQFYLNNPSDCFQVGTARCTELLYIWAPGIDVLEMPQGVSFPMGTASGGSQFAMIQVHYTNPNTVAGEQDSSGVKIYYDTVQTTHLAGILQIGDPTLKGTAIPAGKAAAHYEYTCPSSCTSQLSNSLTIFADALHMHSHGTMMYSTITSGSTGKTASLNRAEFYDYGFQAATSISAVLNPGDRVNTHCIFDTTSATSAVPFSFGTYDEMCIEFLFYYPKVVGEEYCGYYVVQGTNGTVCGTSFQSTTNPVALDDPKFRTKTFGVSPTGTCLAAPNVLVSTPTPAPTSKGKSASTAGISFAVFLLLSIALLFV